MYLSSARGYGGAHAMYSVNTTLRFQAYRNFRGPHSMSHAQSHLATGIGAACYNEFDSLGFDQKGHC